MSKISISVYKITINKKGTPDELENLNDFDNGSDLLDLLRTLPAQFRKVNSEKDVLDDAGTSRRTIIPDKDLKVSGRIISGYISSGDYGLETSIVDAEGEEVYNVSKEHSPMRPFFFFMSLPKDSDFGYLLIQRFENYGVFTILSKMIKQVFFNLYPKYTLTLKPDGIDNSEAIAFLEEGKISKASFAIYNPANIASIFTNNNQNDNFEYSDVKAEIVISAKRNRLVALKNTVLNLVTKDKAAKIKLTDQDIPYERMKIYVKIGKDEKVIDLSKWESFSRDIEVTHELKYNVKTGHPLINSLKNKCHEILDKLVEK